MKKVMFMFISLLTVLGVCSCNDNEVIEPVVSDSVSDMEVLSRFVDVNEITNEYYFNENKKTRALSYVTGSDWQDLEKVSPLSIEKYKNNLQVLNAQVASAISNPNTAYVVFSVNGKTLVKKVKEDANFDFSVFRDVVTETRAVLPSLSINGGSQSTTGVFYDSSRTLKMQVDLNASIQNNYYFFEVLNPNAKPSPDDNITTPESVAFSGTGPLWSNTFTWTSYWDANVPGQGFKWALILESCFAYLVGQLLYNTIWRIKLWQQFIIRRTATCLYWRVRPLQLSDMAARDMHMQRTQRNLDAMSLLVCTRDPSLGQRQKQKDLKYIQQQRLLREQILS